MKKLQYILAGLVLVFALVSCEKQNKHDLDVDAIKAAKANKAVVELGENIPWSDAGVVPEVIPGENKGGNRTCDEVYAYFSNLYDGPYLCGDKIDWDDDAEGFAGSFPDGLLVTVNDIYVSFEIPGGCLNIGGLFYKVGAVIVKGSNAANVYFYPNGSDFDTGLAAPGNKHMVSNLTFCFVPCQIEEADLVVAMKAFVNVPREELPSYGDVIHTVGTPLPNIDFVEYVSYSLGDGPATFVLNSERSGPEVGTMTVDDGMEGEDRYLYVNIDTDDDGWDFNGDGCYLYVGSLAGLTPLTSAGQFPFKNNAPPESRSFKILISPSLP